MTDVHRTFSGSWAVCDAPEDCDLLFHLPNTTVEAAQRLPLQLLLPLFEAVDPPNQILPSGIKVWLDHAGYNRGYDLPSVIAPNGNLQWFRNGKLHRGHDRPALILTDGTKEWWQSGFAHRNGGKPAILHPDGSVEYRQYGFKVDGKGAVRLTGVGKITVLGHSS